MNIKNKRKAKGFILIQAILGLIVMGCVAVMFFQLYGGQFSALAASKESLQAQQYAEFIAGKIRAIDVEDIEATCKNTWDDVENQGLKSVSGWQYKLYCKSEALSEDDPENVIYMVNVAIKKDTDPTSDYGRFSVNVPLSSQGSSSDSFPVGTILAYNGELKDIPKKWALCDGNNGTPNLTGRFLQGWGSDGYNTFSAGEFLSPGLPNITGSFWGHCLGFGTQIYTKGSFYFGGTTINREAEGNSWNHPVPIFSFDASRSSPIYSASKTVQPRSYVIYYIIKIKK